MKKTIFILLAAICSLQISAKDVVMKSPDGKIAVTVTDKGGNISYSTALNGKTIFTQSDLKVVLSTRTLGHGSKIGGVKRVSHDGVIRPLVPMKHAEIHDKYNGAVLSLNGCKLEFRVYDNGCAYRFITQQKGMMEVEQESFNLRTTIPTDVHYQGTNSFRTSSENMYVHTDSKEWTPEKDMSTLPVVFSAKDGSDLQLLISESDVKDYAGMFLNGDGKGGVTSVFPPCPLKWKPDGDRAMAFTEEAKYFAKTNGTRTLPWRYVAITDSKGLLEQTFTAQLGGNCEIEDTSWITPGQVAWDWWNWKQIYGEGVDFEPGCNTQTYKYYIDFAAKYGINWIILDEGWAKNTYTPYESNPDLDLQALIKYGKQKGVGLILWLTWNCVDDNIDKLFETYAKWGVAGTKIDFMDRQDQWMVNYYERVVKEAAKHHILVDFHGAYKPSGLEQRYPNLLSYEGVRGMEQMGGATIDNTVYIPFMRNAVGAADFTPGAMITMQPEAYRYAFPTAAWMGTRAFNMALYIVLESGIQMLSDCPTRYYKEDDVTRFISSVPVTWDETRCLAAEFGQYVIVAKRKGNKWYVGGISNGQQKERHMHISLDFLSDGTHTITSYSDGYNAHRQALDYRKSTYSVSNSDILDITMSRNGGFAAVIE